MSFLVIFFFYFFYENSFNIITNKKNQKFNLIILGFSGFLIYEELSSYSLSLPWSIYSLQLFLNFLLTPPPLFFGFNHLLIAGIEIIILEITIIANICLFININLVAGILLIPYSIWIGFASYLTWAIWWLNRGSELGSREIELGVKEKLRRLSGSITDS